MIPFNQYRLAFAKAYITKITRQYLYITSNDNNTIFEHFNPKVIPNDRYPLLVRIKIDQSVYKTFISNYKFNDFTTPQLCSITAYDNTVIDVELKGFSWGDNNDDWFSQFELSLPSIIKATNNQQAYINGLQIFWIPEDNWQEAQALSKEGEFQIVEADYMGLTRMQRRSHTRRDDEEKQRSFLKVTKGQVIAYSPEKDICTYSPVVSSGIFFAVSDETRNLYMMNSQQNPAYTTLEFILNAAQTIGKLYGYQANDFLNIPRIIQDFGQVNLTKIDPTLRATSPVHIHGTDALAWLMGFMHKEQNLDPQRELVKMFRKIMRTGLIYKNKIDSFFHKDVNGIDDIPLMSWSVHA